MHTKVVKCSACGADHDRVTITQIGDTTFMGACPVKEEPLYIELGKADLPIELDPELQHDVRTPPSIRPALAEADEEDPFADMREGFGHGGM